MAGFIKPNRNRTETKKNEDNATKWSSGIELQSKTAKPLNYKSIPVELINIDPKNARNMHFSIEDIKAAPKITGTSLHDETYVSQLKSFVSSFEDANEKLEEIMKTAKLADSIRKSGLINPITTFMEEMEFQLISGHRRLFASILLDEEEIASNIQDRPQSNVDRYLIQWSENEDREDLQLSEQLKNIKIIISSWEEETEKDISITKLMELLGFKKTQASWYLKTIREMSNSSLYTKLIHENKISSLEMSYKIAQIGTLDIKNSLLQKIDESELSSYADIDDYLKSTVRSPDSKQKNVTKPNIKTDIGFNADILKEIAKFNILNVDSNIFKNLDLSHEKDLKKAWKILYATYNNKDNK